MTSQNNKDTDDTTIFEILAHPLRRKILEEIHNRGNLSYSYFTEQMNLQSGTLYHHLRQMKDLIEQREDKTYQITPKGLKAVELIHSTEGGSLTSQGILTTIPSLKAFSALYRSFSENSIRSFFEGSIIVLIFFWFISRIDGVVIGSFLLASSELRVLEIVLIGFGSWILCLSTVELLARKVYRRQENSLALATACSLIFILPGIIGIVVFILVQLELLASISSATLLLIDIGAQIWSIFILISAVSQLKYLSWERATLIALIANYLQLASVLILFNLNIIG